MKYNLCSRIFPFKIFHEQQKRNIRESSRKDLEWQINPNENQETLWESDRQRRKKAQRKKENLVYLLQWLVSQRTVCQAPEAGGSGKSLVLPSSFSLFPTWRVHTTSVVMLYWGAPPPHHGDGLWFPSNIWDFLENSYQVQGFLAVSSTVLYFGKVKLIPKYYHVSWETGLKKHSRSLLLIITLKDISLIWYVSINARIKMSK